jgi:hypothetical protein
MTIPLRKHWVKTSDWRGYYEYDNSVADGSLLAGYGDPYAESHNRTEKERIAKVKSVLRKNKIPSRVAKARTSNLFAGSYDIVVAKKDLGKAKRLVKKVI